MQSFPYAAPPMSAGGLPVPGIPNVGGLPRPTGVSPSLTQYPTAQPGRYPAQVGPQGGLGPSLGSAYGPVPGPTYAPAGGPTSPSIAHMPGPAMLGPGSGGPANAAAGGLPGVAIGQVSGVMAPAVTGGPHPLPSMPQIPLPQGFPNPFEVTQVGQGAPTSPTGQAGGYQTVTGPAGYLPGLGYFGAPGSGGQAAVPGPYAGQGLGAGSPLGAAMPPGQAPSVAPGAQPALGQPVLGQPALGQPVLGQPALGQSPLGQPALRQPAPGQPAGQGQANPFWLQLAWQLIQTPAVKAAVGDRFGPLFAGDDRGRSLQVAASVLAGPELQNAFKAITAGTLEQTRFTEMFAERLTGALRATGALMPM